MAANPSRRSVSRAAAALVCVTLLEIVAVLSALPQDEPAQIDSSAISGELAAHETRIRIARATVTLGGTTLETTTDSTGHFSFTNLSAGDVVIEARAIGYAPRSWRVTLRPHRVLTHVFELDPLPYELPEVVVKGKQPLSVRHFADFERRRQSGMGAFITQDRIERANTASLVDVLVTVRGVQQICISNQCVAKMVRSPPGCYPQYYVDGHESTAYFARLTPPQDVKGIEIYRGSSETPAEFQNSNAGCGVIAIWTKSAP